MCKDTEQVDDYDTEETADNELVSREIPINSADGIELDEEETGTEESPVKGNNNNDNG